jgi:hypothetical protein
VAIVGQPVTYATGLIVLVLIVVTGDWIKSLVTLAHEGGHTVVGILTFRKPTGIELKEDGSAATKLDTSFGAGDYLVTLAGYLTPPLVGLGGAYALAQGNVWSVLWAAVILGIAAFLQARKALTNVVTVVALAGFVATALFAPALVQTVVAIGLVWLMLLGGAAQSIWLSRADKSDAYWLARRTLLPRVFWHLLWLAVGVACLYKGARLMLGI